jgi:hypothetical protein
MSDPVGPMRVHWDHLQREYEKQGLSKKTITAFKGMFYTGALLSSSIRSDIGRTEDEAEAAAKKTALFEDIVRALEEVDEECLRNERKVLQPGR